MYDDGHPAHPKLYDIEDDAFRPAAYEAVDVEEMDEGKRELVIVILPIHQRQLLRERSLSFWRPYEACARRMPC